MEVAGANGVLVLGPTVLKADGLLALLTMTK